MNATQHLSRHDLLQVLCSADSADSAELEQRVQDHVTDCPDCRGQLESLAASPLLWHQASSILTEEGIGETIAFSSRIRHSPGEIDFTEKTDGYSVKRLLEPPRHPEMLGRLGHYEIEREIGRGGMGVVLKAHDTELNRAVAIKMMAPHLASFGVARQRFAREARSAAAILHPNVIAIHAVSTESSNPWLVMPYIVGPSLEQIVKSQGALDERDLVCFAMQIAGGLAAAHAQGVVHRDIKPANVLIESGMGRVVITDFGLARAEADASMTQTGWFAGTPNFMSPEQALGSEIDDRSDLFSLGSVMYYMATGRLPFRAEGPLAVLQQIREHQPAATRSVNPRISRTLSNLIGRLLAKRPGDRIQSAAEVQQLLEQYLAHLHHPESRARPVVHPPAPLGYQRWGWVWASVACIGLAMAGYFSWLATPPAVNTPPAFEQIMTRYSLQKPETFELEMQRLNRQIESLQQSLSASRHVPILPAEDRLWDEMQALDQQFRRLPTQDPW